jgi:hypothetical protein
MPTSGLRVGLSLIVGHNTLFAEPSSMWSEYRTVVSVSLVMTVFAGLLFVEKPTCSKLVKKFPAFYGL